VLKSQPRKPDLVVIEFGGNDVLRALPPEQTRANLDKMLAVAKAQGVPVLLMGMLAPPNLGPDFKARFEPIYPELARKYGAKLVPFFLAPVIGKPDPTYGEVVKAFVTLKTGYGGDAAGLDALRRDLMGHARKRLGAAVAPKEIDFVDSLPHTRSGKIMRRLLKARELGLPEGDTSTVETPGVQV
jgi:acyl-CoA synthetase (AMP-forming)/AMP-acid ligase II